MKNLNISKNNKTKNKRKTSYKVISSVSLITLSATILINENIKTEAMMGAIPKVTRMNPKMYNSTIGYTRPTNTKPLAYANKINKLNPSPKFPSMDLAGRFTPKLTGTGSSLINSNIKTPPSFASQKPIFTQKPSYTPKPVKASIKTTFIPTSTSKSEPIKNLGNKRYTSSPEFKFPDIFPNRKTNATQTSINTNSDSKPNTSNTQKTSNTQTNTSDLESTTSSLNKTSKSTDDYDSDNDNNSDVGSVHSHSFKFKDGDEEKKSQSGNPILNNDETTSNSSQYGSEDYYDSNHSQTGSGRYPGSNNSEISFNGRYPNSNNGQGDSNDSSNNNVPIVPPRPSSPITITPNETPSSIKDKIKNNKNMLIAGGVASAAGLATIIGLAVGLSEDAKRDEEYRKNNTFTGIKPVPTSPRYSKNAIGNPDGNLYTDTKI